MPITLQQSNQLKAIGVLMMLFLHLFNNLDYQNGLYQPIIFIGEKPLVYYISFFTDACVPIFAFVSGYGLYYKYQSKKSTYRSANWLRLKKLYLNLWLVILVFAVILGLVMNKDGYPGSLEKLLWNLSGIRLSYSFIWWYFTTYVFVVLASPLLFYLLDRYNFFLVFLMSFLLYVIGYYFRIFNTEIFTHPLLQYFHNQGARFCLVQFEFMLGAFLLKYRWIDFLNSIFNCESFSRTQKNSIGCVLILALILFHALVPSLFISPFIALAFIIVWVFMSPGTVINKILDHVATHSTNIWLIHSFFYITYFKAFIFGMRYPLLIFILLVVCSLLSSYVINYFYKKLERLV